MRSVPAVVAAAFGAAVAVIALIGPTTFFVVDSASAGSRLDGIFDSSAATSAAAVLVALAAAVALRRTDVAMVGAAVGLIALAILAFTTPTAGQGTGYPTAIAAGLVLGALAVATHPGPSNSGRAGRMGLAAGVVAGFLLAASLPSSFNDLGENRRYADYLPGHLVSNGSIPGSLIAGGAVIALIGLAAFAFQIKGTTPDVVARPDATVILTGVSIAIALVLVSAWSRESRPPSDGFSPPGWVFGGIMVVIVLAAAVAMPARTGLVWVGVVALVATGAAAGVSDVDWVGVVVAAAIIGVGAVAARWRSLLPVGIAVLVVAVLLQLLDGESSVLVAAVAALFVAPFAASYTVAVCLSESPPSPSSTHPAIIATALSACVPLSTFSGVADFGWTAYTPLTDARAGIDYFGVGFASGTTVTVSVLSLVAAGVVAWVITRRDPPRHEIGHP